MSKSSKVTYQVVVRAAGYPKGVVVRTGEIDLGLLRAAHKVFPEQSEPGAKDSDFQFNYGNVTREWTGDGQPEPRVTLEVPGFSGLSEIGVFNTDGILIL